MPLAKAAEYGFLAARCRARRSQLLPYDTLKEFASARSIGELYNALESTPYAPFLQTVSTEGIHLSLSNAFLHQRKLVIHELKKGNKEIFKLFFETKYSLTDDKTLQSHTKNPEEIFSKIDKDYVNLLKTSMLKLPQREQKELKTILGSYFDLLNLYNLVKFRMLYQLSAKETLTYMFPYSQSFHISELALLCDIENLQQLSQKIKPILGEGFDSYESFRKVLYRYHRKKLLSIWSGYPFSIAIPFSLLRLMEIEISDLRSITEGITFQLSAKDITQMIVGGQDVLS